MCVCARVRANVSERGVKRALSFSTPGTVTEKSSERTERTEKMKKRFFQDI